MSIVPIGDVYVAPALRSDRTTASDVVLGCPAGAMLWAPALLRSPDRTVLTDKGYRASPPSMAGKAIRHTQRRG
jgi:hypothetical protein